MRKTLLIISLISISFFATAQAPVKITFEDAEIGSKGGVVSVWDAGTIEVVANSFSTGNTSGKVLRVPKASYMGLYFENAALPASAETQYSKLRVKYLVVGGTDIDYPSLEVFSAPNNYTMGDTEKIGTVGWAGLWGSAEKGVWKTVEFTFSNTLIEPIPAGNLILKLAKDDCEYLIDDVELVPIPAATTIFTLADFQSNDLNDVLNMRRWTPTDATATVVASPTDANNKVAHIVATNWNSALRMNVALPTGKVLADYENISFDIYLNNIEGTDNVWKQVEVYVGDAKVIDTQSQGVANAWETKSYPMDNFAGGNSFVMDLGLNTNKANYYLDNIKIREKSGTGFNQTEIQPLISYISGNSLILNQPVDFYNLYNVHGACVLSGQYTTSINTSNLSHGIYILKASAGKDKFVTKIIK